MPSHASNRGLTPDFDLRIQPLGSVSKPVVESVREAVASTFTAKVMVLRPMPLPRSAWYPSRHRWLAEPIVAVAPTLENVRTLYVTAEDISRPAHGQANYGILGYTNVNAIVSSFRTHGSKRLIHDIAIHEMGHVLGLPHCRNANCAMQDLQGHASTIQGNVGFCADCRKRIANYLK